MQWQNVPKELTVPIEEARQMYGANICFGQTVSSLYINDEEELVPCTGRVLLRGALENVKRTRRWHNSSSDGGYVEDVIYRYIRKKYNNDLSQFKNMYEAGIYDIVDRLARKHGLHHRSEQSITRGIHFEYFTKD